MFWDRAPDEDEEDDQDCCSSPQKEEEWEWEQEQEQEEEDEEETEEGDRERDNVKAEEEEEEEEEEEQQGEEKVPQREVMRSWSMPSRLDRRGSYFKLVQSFACELGELEQEMGQLRPPQEHPSPALEEEHILLQGLDGLVREMSGVYMGDGHYDYNPLGHCHFSVLDRLCATHPIWMLLSLGDQDITRILLQQPPGSFLVRRSSKLQRKVLSVRLDDASGGQPISHYPVKENQYTFSLEGSGVSFADLFRLVAFYCISRDVLPFTLKLPEAVTSAQSQAELKDLAQLGADCGYGDAGGIRRHISDVHSFQDDNDHTRAVAVEKPLKAPRPPRPPPPRCWPQRPRSLSVPTRGTPVERTMLQTVSHFDTPTSIYHNNATDITPPDYMGANHSSQGPKKSPKKSGGGGGGGGLPAPVSRLHPSKKKKHPDVVDVQRCHIALDDETIAKALAQAKLPHRRLAAPSSPPPPPQEDVHMPSLSSATASPSSSPSRKPPTNNHHHHQHHHQLHHRQPNSPPHNREQRLSCLSFSTTSSGSSGGSTDASAHHSPPQRSPQRSHKGPVPNVDLSTDDEHLDEDDDDDDDDDDDNDYGMGLEQDLQLRLQAPYRRLPLAGSRSAALLILPRALKGKFRKVSGMLGALGTPERRAVRRVLELARNKSSYFGCLVQDYVSFMQENGAGVDNGLHTSAVDLLQTIRHFMTQMKAYLVHSSELQPPMESFVPEEQIDQVLEKAMHKCVLKPLKATVETALNDFQVRSGALQQLRENLALAKMRRPEELGVEGAVPPDAAAVEKIRQKLTAMRKMYSPEKKVLTLLHVCKLIYSIMQDNSGRMFGADDFLPMLTYVLVQCDMPQLDTDIQYMMELLDPALLYGEGGYYLTSAYSAMALIRNLQEEQAARALSTEAQNTLHQWHRRRTTQRSIPAVEDFQNYLRVALQEVDSGCTSKTLQVHPCATTEEISQVCALKFRISDPENYALFLITDGASQQLAPDTHPQRIKAELHSRPHLQDYHFMYRKKNGTAATKVHDYGAHGSASHGVSNGLKD